MFRVLWLGKNGFGFAGGYVLYHFKYSAVLFQASPLRLPVCADLVQGFSEKRLEITTPMLSIPKPRARHLELFLGVSDDSGSSKG